MPMLEYSGGKIFTSTGNSNWQDAYTAQYHAFQFEADAGSSGAWQIQERMKNGTNTIILSSNNIAASSAMEVRLTGGIYQHRIRMKTFLSTGTVTIRWFGT